MINSIDHITIAVSDISNAKEFFTLFGFEVTHDVIIEKEPFVTYMDIKDLKAQHITMRQKNSNFEIQLLYFFSPTPQGDPNINRLDKLGYNHICFNVDDVSETTDLLKSNGVKILTDILTFHSRKLVYLEGPDGIIIELAEWLK